MCPASTGAGCCKGGVGGSCMRFPGNVWKKPGHDGDLLPPPAQPMGATVLNRLRSCRVWTLCLPAGACGADEGGEETTSAGSSPGMKPVTLRTAPMVRRFDGTSKL